MASNTFTADDVLHNDNHNVLHFWGQKQAERGERISTLIVASVFLIWLSQVGLKQ